MAHYGHELNINIFFLVLSHTNLSISYGTQKLTCSLIINDDDDDYQCY